MWSEVMWIQVERYGMNWRDLCEVIKFGEKWNDVEWTDVIYMKWFCFEKKWSDVEWTDVIYVVILFWSEVMWRE